MAIDWQEDIFYNEVMSIHNELIWVMIVFRSFVCIELFNLKILSFCYYYKLSVFLLNNKWYYYF